MSTINDKATVELFVNGEQAEQAMDRLRKKAADLKDQIDQANAAGDSKTAKKLQKELDQVNKQLNRTESAAKGAGIVLNNLSNTNIHGLNNALKYLQRELKMTKPGTEAWHRYADAIEKVKGRIAELNEELEGGESVWDKFKGWATDAWPALDLISGWGSNVYDIMRGAVDAYADMDQEMANVRKFTGMTAEQVADLNEEFKNMDTRTSREDLNKLAQEAGRLGKTSKEDILGFVRAADIINVALDDLGEGATLTLSKLTGVFGIEETYGTEQSLLKVGSVINELSQNCSASAPYLAEFASRMGGVGAQSGMTIQQIMAFGAVLDANGQAVEASSTALSQVIVRMMQEPAKYARVAGLDVQKFTDMLKTDVNGALVLFLETLQKAGGMDTLSPMFADMGENGSRAIGTLSTLAIHIDQVKAQQIEANKAFQEGTSAGEEFAVQNNTVQASIEKAKNALNDLRVELGERLSPLMSHIMSTSSAAIRALLSLVRFVMDNKVAILSLTAGILAYTIAAKAATIATVAHTVATKAATVAKAAWRLAMIASTSATALFTGNIRKATVAFRLFSMTIKASPIGLLVSLITTATVALGGWIYKTKEARREEAELASQREKEMQEYREQISDISKTSAEYAQSHLDRLKRLYEASQDQNKSMNDRITAVKELQKTYPSAFGNLSQEAILTGKAATAYNDLAKNIVKAARAKAAAEKIKENEKELLEIEMEVDDLKESLTKDVSDRERAKVKFEKEGLSGFDSLDVERARTRNERISENEEKLTMMRLRMRELDKANSRLAKEAGDPSEIAPDIEFSTPGLSGFAAPSVPDPVGGKGGSGGKTDRFAEEKAWRERQQAEARIAYATGEATYSEHTERMAEISTEYYEKLLARTDLSADERLKIEADYLDECVKTTEGGRKLLIEDEDRGYQDLLDHLRANHLERLRTEKLSADERKQVEADYAESLELAELQHLKVMMSLYEEGSDKWLEARRNYHEKELAAQQRHLRKMEELEEKYSAVKDKYFGLNAEERQSEYDRQFAALKVVYERELEAAGDNAAEKLRIEEAFLQAQNALRKQYSLDAEEDTRGSLERAVATSAEWLNGEGGKALTGTMSTVISGMSSIFSGLSTLIQAETDLQTAAISKKYDREVELAQGNSYKVAQLEKKKEKEIAKVKNEANRKLFAMQVIQAVAQTAQNALSAYGSAAAIPVVGYILAPIAAAMAVAAGAIQIASIKKQQQASEAQGYSKGGFTRPGRVDEPAGVVHAGEWVASQKLLANPVARPMIDALDRVQRTNTISSLRADDVSRSIRANDTVARFAESDNGMLVMAAVASRLSAVVDSLTERLNEPFVTVNTVTGPMGMKQANDDYSRMIKNVTPKSKRKWIS